MPVLAYQSAALCSLYWPWPASQWSLGDWTLPQPIGFQAAFLNPNSGGATTAD